MCYLLIIFQLGKMHIYAFVPDVSKDPYFIAKNTKN